MAEQRLEILELLPEDRRIDPKHLYIPERVRPDRREVIQATFDWVNFLREEACFQNPALSEDVHALYHAAGYHYNVYNDFHALYFHNLIRNEKFEETIRLTAIGLGRIPVPDFLANCNEAIRIYRSNSDIWTDSFSGSSPSYAAARSVMREVDQTYVRLLKSHDLEALIADSIVGLPNVRFVSEADYANAREIALRSCSRRNERVREILAEREQRETEKKKAESARVRQSLDDDVEFAVEILATMAGYPSVISIGEHSREQSDSGPVELWQVVLRTDAGVPQHNNLMRGHGKFALFDFQMKNVRGVVSESDVTERRKALLHQMTSTPSALSKLGFGRVFGKKK